MNHGGETADEVLARGLRAHAFKGAGGFTYIGVMLLVTLMGIALAGAGEVWHTLQRREKEQELLFVGHQFRLALKRYAEHTPARTRRSPMHLEELLLDPRHPGIRRHLRTIHADPVTGKAEWGVITGPGGEIYGVHSLSDGEPLKKQHFELADEHFEDSMKYSEWVFMHAPG